MNPSLLTAISFLSVAQVRDLTAFSDYRVRPELGIRSKPAEAPPVMNVSPFLSSQVVQVVGAIL
jgi:hypothetical protein